MSDSTEFASGYAFRLVYNGAVLTPRMDGCDVELCDSQVLVNLVMPFAMFEERDCASTYPAGGEPAEVFIDSEDNTAIPEPNQAAKSAQESARQKWLILGVAILSGAVGSMITSFTLRRHYERAFRQATGLTGDLSMVESTGYYEGNGTARNGGRVNAVSPPSRSNESDEDRII